ncbi:sugar transferase [Pimelobacter simplex]|nr:sugar transferase [Pimelobacter simplex]
MTVVDRAPRHLRALRPRPLPLVPATVLVGDAVLLGLTVVLAVLGREKLTLFTPPAGVRSHLEVAAPLILLGWLLTIGFLGGYRREVLGAGTDEFKRVFQASLLTSGLVGIGCYLAKFTLPRGFFVLAFLIGPMLLLLGRWVARQLLHVLRRRGLLASRVLVAGSVEGSDAMTRVLRRESWLGYAVVGAVVPSGSRVVDETRTGVPVLGDVAELTELVDAHAIDLVLFAPGSVTDAAEMKQVIWALERHRVRVALTPQLDNISHERIAVRPVGGVPLIHVDSPTWTDAGAVGKRVFDVVGAMLLLLALSPLLAVAAASVWLHDRGPVLFSQLRVGRDGRPFRCLKLRTMRVDAEAQVALLMEETAQDALLFKVKDDPRITRPGHWLRRYSVDELPQLLNVLRGDMSLVGPRPQVEREVAMYDGAMTRRLLVRPGMTGLWQVSGRNDLRPDEAMRLDLYYVDNWSMLQDLAILVRTAHAVVGARGAY